jgi:hypothetical protein
MAGGQAITSSAGTLVAEGGDGNQALTGGVATSAAGTTALNRLISLRSRKAGTGTASLALSGSVLTGSTGTLVYSGEAFALVGSQLTGAQGTLLYRGLVTLAWDAVTTDQGGGPLTGLAGYRVYHGTTNGGPYPDMQDVGNVLTMQYGGLLPGFTHFFVVRAYDPSNNEGANSNQLSKTF